MQINAKSRVGLRSQSPALAALAMNIAQQCGQRSIAESSTSVRLSRQRGMAVKTVARTGLPARHHKLNRHDNEDTYDDSQRRVMRAICEQSDARKRANEHKGSAEAERISRIIESYRAQDMKMPAKRKHITAKLRGKEGPKWIGQRVLDDLSPEAGRERDEGSEESDQTKMQIDRQKALQWEVHNSRRAAKCGICPSESLFSDIGRNAIKRLALGTGRTGDEVAATVNTIRHPCEVTTPHSRPHKSNAAPRNETDSAERMTTFAKTSPINWVTNSSRLACTEGSTNAANAACRAGSPIPMAHNSEEDRTTNAMFNQTFFGSHRSHEVHTLGSIRARDHQRFTPAAHRVQQKQSSAAIDLPVGTNVVMRWTIQKPVVNGRQTYGFTNVPAASAHMSSQVANACPTDRTVSSCGQRQPTTTPTQSSGRHSAEGSATNSRLQTTVSSGQWPVGTTRKRFVRRGQRKIAMATKTVQAHDMTTMTTESVEEGKFVSDSSEQSLRAAHRTRQRRFWPIESSPMGSATTGALTINATRADTLASPTTYGRAGVQEPIIGTPVSSTPNHYKRQLQRIVTPAHTDETNGEAESALSTQDVRLQSATRQVADAAAPLTVADEWWRRLPPGMAGANQPRAPTAPTGGQMREQQFRSEAPAAVQGAQFGHQNVSPVKSELESLVESDRAPLRYVPRALGPHERQTGPRSVQLEPAEEGIPECDREVMRDMQLWHDHIRILMLGDEYIARTLARRPLWDNDKGPHCCDFPQPTLQQLRRHPMTLEGWLYSTTDLMWQRMLRCHNRLRMPVATSKPYQLAEMDE